MCLSVCVCLCVSVCVCLSVCVCKSKTKVGSVNRKLLYESKLLCDYANNTNQKIFNYIQSNRRQAAIPHTVFFDYRFLTNDHDKANLFNEFFQSVFKSSNIPPPDSSFLYQLLILFWETSLSLRLMCTLPSPT